MNIMFHSGYNCLPAPRTNITNVLPGIATSSLLDRFNIDPSSQVLPAPSLSVTQLAQLVLNCEQLNSGQQIAVVRLLLDASAVNTTTNSVEKPLNPMSSSNPQSPINVCRQSSNSSSNSTNGNSNGNSNSNSKPNGKEESMTFEEIVNKTISEIPVPVPVPVPFPVAVPITIPSLSQLNIISLLDEDDKSQQRNVNVNINVPKKTDREATRPDGPSGNGGLTTDVKLPGLPNGLALTEMCKNMFGMYSINKPANNCNSNTNTNTNTNTNASNRELQLQNHHHHQHQRQQRQQRQQVQTFGVPDGRKPYVCTASGCGRRFKHQTNLKIHTSIHGSSALRCDFCDKKFARKSNLRQHLRVHTGERPFVCIICSRGFKQRHSLKDHSRIHRRVSSYMCTVCKCYFSCDSDLKNHFSALHKL